MEARRIIHLVPRNAWSYPARYSLDLCHGMAAAGWRVTAYTCNAVALDTPFAERGIDLRHAPLRGLSDAVTAGLLTRHLRLEERGTIVHTHRFRDAFCAILAAKAAARPDIRVIITRHLPRRARNSWLYRFIYRHVGAFLFTSERVREAFTSTWGEQGHVPQERLHVIPPSIPDTPAEPWPEPNSGPLTARYAAAPAPGCGVETLIDSLPYLRGKRIRLKIPFAPDPDYSDTLRLRAEELGCADLIDWCAPPSAATGSLRGSHFCILPEENADNLPDTGLECLAGGRAAIAPGREPAPMWVSVPAGDPAALADAIQRLAADPGLRQATGREAFAHFRSRYSWKDYIGSMAALYSSL